MPAIRLVVDAGTPDAQAYWFPITDYKFDQNNDYLEFFTVEWEGQERHVYLFRNTASLFELAGGIFSGATSLRSARGLMKDFNAAAESKLGWKGKPGAAGAAGWAISSVMLLHDYLNRQPLRQEGYYDGNNNLFLPRTIRKSNKNDYKPD